MVPAQWACASASGTLDVDTGEGLVTGQLRRSSAERGRGYSSGKYPSVFLRAYFLKKKNEGFFVLHSS